MAVPGTNTHGHVVEDDDDREFLFLANNAAIAVSLRPPMFQEPRHESILWAPILCEPCHDPILLPPIPREPYHNSILSGGMFMREMLTGHEGRFKENFGMAKIPFMGLLRILVERGYLEESPKKHIEPYEALGMFLYLVSQKGTYSDVGQTFQHSVATVMDNYWRVVQALVNLGHVIVRPYNNHPHRRILYNSRFYPWFQDCIGAVDGTLIPCIVPKTQSRCARENSTGMNVLAACDYDSLFVFLSSGWESSADDPHIVTEVSPDPLHKFPVPIGGKYYLVDGGFTQCKGFMAPYKDHRYHLRRDGDGEPPPQQMEELFNDRHASMRSIVETSFSILKSRFPILTRLPRYKGHGQADVVLALCTVHNFIRIHGKDDELFVNEAFTGAIDAGTPEYVVGQLDYSNASIDEMVAQRDSIGVPMWHYAQHIAAAVN